MIYSQCYLVTKTIQIQSLRSQVCTYTHTHTHTNSSQYRTADRAKDIKYLESSECRVPRKSFPVPHVRQSWTRRMYGFIQFDKTKIKVTSQVQLPTTQSQDDQLLKSSRTSYHVMCHQVSRSESLRSTR